MIKSISVWSFLPLMLAACSGLEMSEQKRLREHNTQKEVIYRNDSDKTYVIETPIKRTRDPYPWEPSEIGKFPLITKEFFRCKGSSLHPPKSKEKDSSELIFDCDGILKHSLPVRGGKEFVFPILLDLINYIQIKTSHRVVITCGHRCPAHNTYSDPSISNQSSKHMIGAEVDFYVEGMEQTPEKIVELIMGYFSEKQPYQGHKEYEKFLRLETKMTNVSTAPWYNKEILIKLYKKDEGRDFDNKHSFPYLCLQVRFDRDLSEKVTYSWDKAFKGFLRY